MSRKLKVRSAGGEDSLRALLRTVGRLGLWAAVALLLYRGAAAVLAAPDTGAGLLRPAAPSDGKALDAFALRFARVYLEDPRPAALRALLAAGASVPAGALAPGSPAALLQTAVVAAREVGDRESVLTVACELRGGGAIYLEIPLLRDRAGRVAALGLPAAVPPPHASGAAVDAARPPAGPEGEEIAALVEHFLPAYLSARNAAEYSYLVAPGAWVPPLAGGYAPIGAPSVRQLGDGEGPRRRILATIRLRDRDGRVYPFAYRLDLVRRERWYVAGIEGALS
jgi:hypothetical protein